LNELFRIVNNPLFQGKILAWLKDYLSNRTILVALQRFNSNEHPIDAGLPQGSILWPTLFNPLVIVIFQLGVNPSEGCDRPFTD